MGAPILVSLRCNFALIQFIASHIRLRFSRHRCKRFRSGAQLLRGARVFVGNLHKLVESSTNLLCTGMLLLACRGDFLDDAADLSDVRNGGGKRLSHVVHGTGTLLR